MKGKFIVLEGPDGSGTTTHAKLVAERLRKEGKDVLLTAEPTDGPIGTFIREQLKQSSDASSMPAAALQLLFTADREWHLRNVIEPVLAQGKTVVCDRYILSTLIYGKVYGESLQWLKELNKNFILPHVLFVLLPSFEIGMQRIGKRTDHDQFEEESTQKKVYDAYRACTDDETVTAVIDTSKDIESAHEEIYSSILSL